METIVVTADNLGIPAIVLGAGTVFKVLLHRVANTSLAQLLHLENIMKCGDP